MQYHQNQIEMQSVADTHLVISAKQGDADAFAELVKRHTKRVFSVAWHLTHSREDAEDITQETFLKACCHLRDFQEKAQFSTWLTRIAVNTALTKIRSSKSAPICADEEPIWESMSEELSDWRSNPEELYSRSQLRQRLQEALEELPQIYSKVFVLREMYGFSIAETAAALKLRVPTVKTRLLRARLQLRDNLRKSLLPTWTEAEHARSNLVARVRPLALDCSSSEPSAFIPSRTFSRQRKASFSAFAKGVARGSDRAARTQPSIPTQPTMLTAEIAATAQLWSLGSGQ